ncbi:ABC transporter substrate-binding protein [Pantoea ananatis]
MEPAGDQRQYWFHRRHQPADLAGSSGKILGTRAEWVKENPNTARALTSAVLEAARWIDASDDNRRETAQVLSGRAWINTKPETLEGAHAGPVRKRTGSKMAGSPCDAFLSRRQ